MPRVCGVDIPKDKRIEIALTYIHGVGRTGSNKILDMIGIDPNIRAKDLTEGQVADLTSTITKNFTVEGDLRRDVASNIKRIMDIGTYRGIRYRKSLPVRGQRTSTNARTRKGPRRTVGAQRKKT